MFILILMYLDRFPAWVLTACWITAIALPIICYLTIVAEARVYRSWLELCGEVGRGMVSGVRALGALFSIDTIRRCARLVRVMRACPATFDDWLAVLLFPFKFYVIVALPFMWSCHAIYSKFSAIPSRIGRSDAVPVILTGYVICLLVLLAGAVIQTLFSQRGRSTQTVVVFLSGALVILLWPWMLVEPGLSLLPGLLVLSVLAQKEGASPD